MRELSKKEMHKKDCLYCADCRSREYKNRRVTGYKPVPGNASPRFLYCIHDKCPYKKEDFNVDLSLFDRMRSWKE